MLAVGVWRLNGPAAWAQRDDTAQWEGGGFTACSDDLCERSDRETLVLTTPTLELVIRGVLATCSALGE
jgi:hypothetical protein